MSAVSSAANAGLGIASIFLQSEGGVSLIGKLSGKIPWDISAREVQMSAMAMEAAGIDQADFIDLSNDWSKQQLGEYIRRSARLMEAAIRDQSIQPRDQFIANGLVETVGHVIRMFPEEEADDEVDVNFDIDKVILNPQNPNEYGPPNPFSNKEGRQIFSTPAWRPEDFPFIESSPDSNPSEKLTDAELLQILRNRIEASASSEDTKSETSEPSEGGDQSYQNEGERLREEEDLDDTLLNPSLEKHDLRHAWAGWQMDELGLDQEQLAQLFGREEWGGAVPPTEEGEAFMSGFEDAMDERPGQRRNFHKDYSREYELGQRFYQKYGDLMPRFLQGL